MKSNKYDRFVAAMAHYQRAIQELNSREIQLAASGYFGNELSKEDIKRAEMFRYGMAGSAIDALSLLAFLRLKGQIPKDTYCSVDNALRAIMSVKKDLKKEAMKNAMKKNKDGSLTILWNKIKKDKRNNTNKKILHTDITLYVVDFIYS